MIALFLLSSGCVSEPPKKGPAAVTPPVPFNEVSWRAGGMLPGKSTEEVRRLLRGAIDTPVTLNLRTATLQAAAAELSEKTGLGIGITPDALGRAGQTFDLTCRTMPARYVLDWITRLAGVYYAIERPGAVFIMRDRSWASQDRLTTRSYAVGALARISRPIGTKYDHARETKDLLSLLRYCLRHTMTGHRDAKLLADDTGTVLTALLTPRGHAKLERIIEELKKPRQYEPPQHSLDDSANDPANLLKAPALCNFEKQDIRLIAAELGKRANVNIGFDYRLADEQHRAIALALGEVTLAEALDAIAKAAGLGEVVAEPGRRFWILGKHQTRQFLRTTGQLPWDRAVVRSYYIEPLVTQFGVKLIFDAIRAAVTPGEWDGELPLAFYHGPTGRMIVLHDEEAQQAVADCIDRMVNLAKPKPPAPRNEPPSSKHYGGPPKPGEGGKKNE